MLTMKPITTTSTFRSGQPREVGIPHALEPPSVGIEGEQRPRAPAGRRAALMLRDDEPVAHDRRQQRIPGIGEVHDIDLPSDGEREIAREREAVDAGGVHGEVEVRILAHDPAARRAEHEREAHIGSPLQHLPQGFESRLHGFIIVDPAVRAKRTQLQVSQLRHRPTGAWDVRDTVCTSVA